MAFSHWLFFRNFPSQVFDRVLNMPVDYLSCFAVILRGMHKKVDIWQIDYSIHSKLRIFSYSEVIHGNTTFKLTKGQQRLKENDQVFSFSSFFCFLCSNVPDNKCHKQKWRVLFFTRFKLVVRVLACMSVIARIKWRRLLLQTISL